MLELILKLRDIYRRFAEDEMTVYGAQASFFIILSLFPFTMLLLTMIQILPGVSQTQLIKLVLELTPENYRSLAFRVINDLSLKSPATMISLTAVTALWASSRGMMSIARGLNRIQGKTEKRWYVIQRLIYTGYTIVFLLVCVFSLVLLIFDSSLESFVLRYLPLLAELITGIISFRMLLALWIFILGFTAIYTYVPEKKLRFRSQLPGAIFSTVCWIGFSMAFALYFKYFGGRGYSYMYGSLAAAVLLMLWLYGCICILFFGAELNLYLSDSSRGSFKN